MTQRTVKVSLPLVLSAVLAGAALAQDAPAPEAGKPPADSAAAAPAPPARPARRRSDTIYRDQVMSRSFASAYDVIEAYKNNWLIRRPSPNFQAPSMSTSRDTTGGASGSGGGSSSQPSASMQQPEMSPDRSSPGMDGGIQVYLDGARMGDIEQLRTIPVSLIQFIRHYSPIDAQARFGIGHNAGAIMVSTRPDTGQP